MKLLGKTVKYSSLIGLLFFSACASYTPLSPGELAARGTHSYPNVSREKLTEASAVALSSLGYNVTQKQNGVVRTAPRSVISTTTGYTYSTGSYGGATNSSFSSHAAESSEDSLAWTLKIEKSGSGVVVHATPHGFRNGSEMKNDKMWVKEVIDSKFEDLWSQIDSVVTGS